MMDLFASNNQRWLEDGYIGYYPKTIEESMPIWKDYADLCTDIEMVQGKLNAAQEAEDKEEVYRIGLVLQVLNQSMAKVKGRMRDCLPPAVSPFNVRVDVDKIFRDEMNELTKVVDSWLKLASNDGVTLALARMGADVIVAEFRLDIYREFIDLTDDGDLNDDDCISALAYKLRGRQIKMARDLVELGRTNHPEPIGRAMENLTHDETCRILCDGSDPIARALELIDSKWDSMVTYYDLQKSSQ